MPLPISVIIPCRNDAPTLTAAVESALAADAGEVVIVNDASTDNTSAIGAGLTFVDSRVRYVNSPLPVRGGVCFARNLGISKARHELIAPLDADDLLMPDGLEALIIGQLHTESFVYGAWIEGEEISLAPPLIRLPEKNVSQATWLFSKAMWSAVGGYNATFELGCEDWALMLSMVEYGFDGVKIASPTHIRKLRPDGRAARCYARREAILALLHEHFPKTMGVQDHT